MVVQNKPLLALCAGDLMSQNVVMIPEEMSLQAAARVLSRAQVTGAPVVDGEGRCVGVLSATDFLHWAERGGPREKPANHCLCQPWQMVESEELPETAVRLNMTRDPVTAPANMSLADLARMMLDAHIHRVIVVDKQRRPLGVVSTTDILAAVAYTQKNMLGEERPRRSGVPA